MKARRSAVCKDIIAVVVAVAVAHGLQSAPQARIPSAAYNGKALRRCAVRSASRAGPGLSGYPLAVPPPRAGRRHFANGDALVKESQLAGYRPASRLTPWTPRLRSEQMAPRRPSQYARVTTLEGPPTAPSFGAFVYRHRPPGRLPAHHHKPAPRQPQQDRLHAVAAEEPHAAALGAVVGEGNSGQIHGEQNGTRKPDGVKFPG